MKLLWDGESPLGNPPKTYKTWENAKKAAERLIPKESLQRVIIAATKDGRFFPVALGHQAADAGLHFHMCIA